jgi:hypothetical protein
LSLLLLLSPTLLSISLALLLILLLLSPRHSTHPYAPLKAIQAARDTVLDEAAAKAMGLDWATGHKKPNMTARA